MRSPTARSCRRKARAHNLLVPVAMSATHIAYGSIRMEPVFMILGQSAATAAVMAIDDGLPVQDVPYAKLRERLLKDGQILTTAARRTPAGSIRRSSAASCWMTPMRSSPATGRTAVPRSSFIGDGYRHDGNAKDGRSSARFSTAIAKPGKYRVQLASPPNTNRASNAPVEVHHAGGVAKMKVDLKSAKPGDGVHWIDLGTYNFSAEAAITISNTGTDGYVVIDGARWLPAKD